MKKVLFVAIILLLLINPVFARKGIGMVTHTESIVVDEGSQKCITYGVFNPWDEDVRASLDIKGDINSIITQKETQPKLIKALTTYQESTELELCFFVPQVYQEKCILGLSCYQPCTQEPIEYKGEVIAVEAREESTSGTGSATSLGISSPLTVKVNCQETERSFSQLYFIIIIISMLGILIILYKRYKK